ncbi:MAG: amidohydrolase family protein [Halioglobus sp.]
MILVRKILIAILASVVLLFSLLLAVLTLADRGLPAALEPKQGAITTYVIRGASVLSMEQNTAHENWAVVVEDGVISALGPNDSVEAPDKAQVIDGQGKTLMPGLIDMHVHLYDEAELAAFLSHGVTTVRNAGGMPFHLELQDRLEASAILGPRFLTSGAIINEKGGRNANILQIMVAGPAEARAVVRRQHEQGYGSIKVYSNLSLESYAAILDEAEKLDMPVFGHPVEGQPPTDDPMAKAPFDLLLDDGLVDMEHMESIIWHALDQDMDEDKVRVLARKMAAAGVVVDPTLIVHHNLTELTRTRGAHMHRAEMEMFNPLVLLFDQASYVFWASYEGDSEIRLADFYRRSVKIFHEEGVVLTVGTDSGAMVTLPGSSVSRELELFVGAGLTPFEALKSATVHPARVLELEDEIGKIRVGYSADMILVDGDPLADVSVVEHPVGVMQGGVWLDQADLAELHEAAKSPSLIRSLRHLIGHLLAKT